MSNNSNKNTTAKTWAITGVVVSILHLIYISVTRLVLGWGEFEDFFLPVIMILCMVSILVSVLRSNARTQKDDKK